MNMTLDEAIEILELHNEWRRGAETPMETPAKLGIAIDLIVSELKDSHKQNNNRTWSEIYEDYNADEYPAFGGPFTHAMTFIEWLKLNYNPPTPKTNKNE